MAYPNLPFPNHTWRISHHQGVLTPRVLNALLFAASIHQDSRDPSQEINNYLAANEIVPPNIRGDSRQSDIWRDYQQLLPELGLIRSTRDRLGIRLNPVGLSFLDGGIGFQDLATIQAFRWQYPNGQNTQRTARQSSSLDFAAQQAASGVLIKPAVLLWQLLDWLDTQDQTGYLSAKEIEAFAIPISTHDDLGFALEALQRIRHSGSVLRGPQTPRRRNASDWMKRLAQTHAFTINSEGLLCLSRFSLDHREAHRNMMQRLSQPEAFWIYASGTAQAISWNSWYGTLDSNAYPIPDLQSLQDYGSEPEPDDDKRESSLSIDIRPYIGTSSDRTRASSAVDISSVYSAEISNSAHRLHDSMVQLIAETCQRRHLRVFSDPATLDLLIDLESEELLIEVKSATSTNLVHKIRQALGQVMYYDFLRSRQTEKTRRRGVALTLGIREDHWSRDFLPGYLDVDLITLKNGRLLTYSRSRRVADLLS